MASNNTIVDCTGDYISKAFPPGTSNPYAVQPDADIAGIGVIVGFATTSLIVTIILICYYVTTFQSGLDPFRTYHIGIKDHLREESVSSSAYNKAFKPNPIDQLVLRQVPASISSRVTDQETLRWYEECVLNLSDTQILTGFAILISGYCNLRNGISGYHWQMIVNLAWFSSTTHLAALTVLRNHLHNHPEQRIWRLVAMFLFLIMLMVGIFYTGDDRMNVFSAISATCVFRAGVMDVDRTSMEFLSMIISLLVLAFSFGMRVIKAHELTSQWLNWTLRNYLSSQFQRLLRWARHDHDNSYSTATCRHSLLYRPLLALFLVARLLLDFYSSMLFEIYWLSVAVVWGIARILALRNAMPRKYQAAHHGVYDFGYVIEAEDSWKFGQILPVLLLALPLIVCMEYFSKLRKDHSRCESSRHTVKAMTSQTPHCPKPEQILPTIENKPSTSTLRFLDQDYYREVSWFKFLMFLAMFESVSIVTLVLVFVGYGASASTTIAVLILPIVVVPSFTLFGFAVLAIVITESVGDTQHGRKIAKWLNVLLTMAMTIMGVVMFFILVGTESGAIHKHIVIIILGSCIGAYFFVSVVGSWTK